MKGCKCIDKYEEAIPKSYEVDGNKVVSASFDNVNLYTWQTISWVNLRYQKGEKTRNKKMALFHKFCPFCGKAYPSPSKRGAK